MEEKEIAVIVVDACELTEPLVKGYLENVSSKVFQVRNAKEAIPKLLEIRASFKGSIKTMINNILPGKNGLSLIQEIKEKKILSKEDILLVISSYFDFDESKIHSPWVMKPFRKESILNFVQGENIQHNICDENFLSKTRQGNYLWL